MNACSALARDAALAAGQRLQLLVGIRQSVAAHDRLHRFGEHIPAGIQILCQTRRVRFDPRESSVQRNIREQAVPESDADIAQHRGVA